MSQTFEKLRRFISNAMRISLSPMRGQLMMVAGTMERRLLRGGWILSAGVFLSGCREYWNPVERVWVPDGIGAHWVLALIGVGIVVFGIHFNSISKDRKTIYIIGTGLSLTIISILVLSSNNRRYIEQLTFINNYDTVTNICNRMDSEKFSNRPISDWYLAAWRFRAGAFQGEPMPLSTALAPERFGFPNTSRDWFKRSRANAMHTNINLNVRWFVGGEIDKNSEYTVTCSVDLMTYTGTVDRDATDSDRNRCSRLTGSEWDACYDEMARALK